MSSVLDTGRSEAGSHDTAGIVVAYRPNVSRLRGGLVRLAEQCDVLLIDNGEEAAGSPELRQLAAEVGAEYLGLGGNRGIAAAQNAGIARMLKRGKQYFLLLDDDSLIAPGLVKRLREMQDRLRSAGEPVAAVGARARSSTGEDISNARPRTGSLTRVREMMSSGALIRAETMREVGWMDEGLFIDCVDFDWGWRAQARGMRLYLADDVFIEHQLGVGVISLLGIRLGVPAPIRHYYQYRNVLKMLGRSHVPLAWKLKQALVLLGKPLVFLLLVAPRMERMRYMWHGVRDALRGTAGRYGG